MIESRIILAENDVLHSPDLRVLGRFDRIKESDKKKGNKRRETTLIAVGNGIERGEAWNTHISSMSVAAECGKVSIERHTAFDRTEEGTSVLEVLLFDNTLHAERVCEGLEQAERNRLEVINPTV